MQMHVRMYVYTYTTSDNGVIEALEIPRVDREDPSHTHHVSTFSIGLCLC